MNTYLDSRIISLNSSYAILLNSTYKSWVKFQFSGLLKEEDDILKIELSLVNAQIPISWYIINYTNNMFKIKLGNNTEQIFTIPVGNYNANSLITTLNLLINDSNFIITISKITGKITFTYNNSFIIYTNIDNSIGIILGFELNNVYNSTNSLTCPYPLNLLGYKRLEIYTQDIQTMNYSSANNSMSTLLSIIPIDQSPWGLITFNNYTDTKNIIKNKTIDKIEIIIRAEDKTLINFNNIDWTLKLKIDITRKYNISDKSNENNIKNLKSNDVIQNDDIIKNDLDLLTYK